MIQDKGVSGNPERTRWWNWRDGASALNLSLLRNGWLLGGLALGNVLHFAVVYTEPLARIFHTVPIPFADFFLIGAVASGVLWVEEARKWIARRNCKAMPNVHNDQ